MDMNTSALLAATESATLSPAVMEFSVETAKGARLTSWGSNAASLGGALELVAAHLGCQVADLSVEFCLGAWDVLVGQVVVGKIKIEMPNTSTDWVTLMQ